MFNLTLVTPEKKILTDREIEEVFVPAARGELNILPGHAPLMTTLSTGVLRYRLKGETELQFVAISWGYCQVTPKGVNILAETAERPEELDIERIERARKQAEEKLLSDDVTPDSFDKFQRKLSRAKTRKDALEFSGKSVH